MSEWEGEREGERASGGKRSNNDGKNFTQRATLRRFHGGSGKEGERGNEMQLSLISMIRLCGLLNLILRT